MFQGKRAVLIGVTIVVFLALSGTGQARTANLPSYVVAPMATEQCVAGNVAICGVAVPMPDTAMGASVTLAVSSPYMHQPFTAQCTPSGFQIIDASAVTCALLSCPASNVTLCGASIPIAGGTPIGGRTEVPVPDLALADPSSTSALTFTAQCVDDGHGSAVYQTAGNQEISCNLFPCPDSRIRLCETMIPIQGGTPLGGVLHLFMPPPFNPDPFTIQCVGSGGNPPVYQLTDASAISCGVKP